MTSMFQSPAQWRGKFISAEPESDRDKSYSTLLRRTFTVGKPLREAWLVCTAHGLYHAHINGRRVSQDELAPGWTSYNKRLLYQSYEVTGLLQEGENALGVAQKQRVPEKASVPAAGVHHLFSRFFDINSAALYRSRYALGVICIYLLKTFPI